MTPRPTPNQKGVQQGRETRARIVDTLVKLSVEHDRAPTRADIAKAMGLSVTMVYRHVRTLIAEGTLEEPARGSLRLKE